MIIILFTNEGIWAVPKVKDRSFCLLCENWFQNHLNFKISHSYKKTLNRVSRYTGTSRVTIWTLGTARITYTKMPMLVLQRSGNFHFQNRC